MEWKSRITGQGELNPSEIKLNALNFREHPSLQKDALSVVLKKIGIVQNVIINKTTGNLLDGHLRVKLAIDKKVSSIPVVYVELSEDEEKIILATLDPITAMANNNTESYAALISQVESKDDSIQKLLYSIAGIKPEERKDITDEPIVKKARININFDQFKFFHAIVRPSNFISRLNYLISYAYLPESFVKHEYFGEIMLDSGILTLAGTMKEKCLGLQKEIVAISNRIKADRVIMLDIPSIPQCLEPLNLTVDQANKITKDNAAEFAVLETNARKVYVIHGPDYSHYYDNSKYMKQFLKDNDCIAIAGLKDKSSNIEFISKAASIVTEILPGFDTHLLGVGTPQSIAPCLQYGINSSDSAHASLATGRAFSALHYEGFKLKTFNINDHHSENISNSTFWHHALDINNMINIEMYIKSSLFLADLKLKESLNSSES